MDVRPRSVPLHRPSRATQPVPVAMPAALTWAQWAVLAAATAVAAWLRFAHLGTWSMWIDEAHTWRDARMPWAMLDPDRKLYALTFTLLRQLLDGGWIAGDEFSLRLPFAIVGIATIPLLALCGRRLIGAWPAILAAWFWAVNPWHVYWSQNARGYVLMLTFATLAANRAFAWIDSHRARDFFAMILAIAVGSAWHPTGALQIAGVAAFALLRRGRSVAKAVGFAVVVAVGTPILVRQLPFQGFVAAKDDPSLLHFVQTAAFYYGPLMLMLAAAGVVLGRERFGRDRSLLLACLWIVPMFVLAVIAASVVKVTARYSLCTLPVVSWLAAAACARVGQAILGGASVGGGARLLGALVLPALVLVDSAVQTFAYHGDRRGDRARWKESVEFVRERAGGRPIRVVAVTHPIAVYYLRPEHWSAGPENPYPDIVVWPLIDWMLRDGVDEQKRRVCEPGAANHFRWHAAQAERDGAAFFVMVTLPELAEMDNFDTDGGKGAVLRLLSTEYDLVLHLPCWVGPKDESVYVFAPRRE